MKLKNYILILMGVIGWSLAGYTQDNGPATDSPPQPAKEQPAVAPASDPAVHATPSAIIAANDATPAAAPAAAAAETTTAAPAATTTTNEPGATIPLILMDDVPLTDAVRNLARQAGLNYMLDPKLAFGQPGPDGRPQPQPMVSVRWENITAEQALGALLANHNLQLVDDPKNKIVRITVKDPLAPDPLVPRVFQLKFASPTNILESLITTMVDKRSRAVADVRTSQIVVLATEKDLAEAEKLINKLDAQTKQVLIEARLVETSINPESVKGIDWSGTLQAQNLKFGNNLQQNSPSASVNNTLSQTFPKMLFDTAKGFNPATAFLDADGVTAVLSFMNKYSEAKVLSAPRAVTLDNETATISVTRASPIFKNTAGTQGSPGGSEVTYTNLGVLLNVTPRISANQFVNLHVVPEVSRVFDTVTKVVSDTVNQADRYDIRKIDTRVMIPSGNTLVLGGLVQDDIKKSNNKVPLLGDIPGLGILFRSDSNSRAKGNLMIFITPTIISDSDYQPTPTSYMKNTFPKEDSMEPDWSSWNSGKPHDWSQPSAKSAEGNYSEVDLSAK